MSATYNTTAGAFIIEIQPLESNGIGNLSTPRQLVDVEFLDKSFTTPTDAFIVNDDVSVRFTQGFAFDIVGGGPYDGSYVVDATGFLPGATVAQVIDNQTHIPVASIVDANLPVSYDFYAGFTTPSVTPTTPHNYLITWEVDGDVSALVNVNDMVQFKHILYNDNVTNGRVNRTYIVTNVTYSGSGYTNVVTALVDETPASITPIIGVDAQSTFVTPIPEVAPFGYVQYTVPTAATSIGLVGKGAPLFNNTTSWGNALQSNMVHMLENFADIIPPVAPMSGQLWYDTSVPALQLFGSTKYDIVGRNTGTNTWTVVGNQSAEAGLQPGKTVIVYNNSGLTAESHVYTIVTNTLVMSGNTNLVVTGDMTGANPDGTMYSFDDWHGVVAEGMPVQGDIDMNTHKIENLGDATAATDALNLQTGDLRYVNVSGDTMTGDLDMTGANITLDTGDVLLGTSSNTISILNNGAAAGSIVFDTASATLTSGNNVIDLGTNMLTGLSNAVGVTDAVSLQFADGRYVNLTGDTMTGALILNADPSVALGAATKQYVDMFVSGIIWITPVFDPNLFDDSLSAPPVDDGFTQYHKTFIVNGTGTGAWTGFDGHLMAWDGTTWQSVLGRAVIPGDRFGVFCEPDDDDPLSTLPGGGLVGSAGKIVDVLTVTPYTYTFYTPAEPDAFSVKGVFGNSSAYQSPHMGHSYTFRGTYGVGSFGSGYQWIEFSGPQMIIDGAGIHYTGNTLNVGAGTGIVVGVDDVSLEPIIQGAAGTSFVKVALDGYGRVTNNLAVGSADINAALGYTAANDGSVVHLAGGTMSGALILNADPVTALGAATKQYVDTARTIAFRDKVLGLPGVSAKALLAVTSQAFTLPATPATPSCYGYADTAATAQTDFDIQKNGVSVGTMSFAIAANVATFTVSSPVSFVPGDRLAVIAPASPDATLADAYFTLIGVLV